MKIEKLLQNLQSKPKDFRWKDLQKIMIYFGFILKNGKGSRRKFIHPDSALVVSLHEPHGNNPVDLGAIQDIVRSLTENGFLDSPEDDETDEPDAPNTPPYGGGGGLPPNKGSPAGEY